MIGASNRWTSSVALAPTTEIYIVELRDFAVVQDIRVDTDLDSLGIVFDYQHVVTGKGLSDEQASALLELSLSRAMLPSGSPQAAAIPSVKAEEDHETPTASARFLEVHLQWFVFNNLNCLGLDVPELVQPERQIALQGKYTTDEVGEMDLLLRVRGGDLVVVELKKSGTDRTIGQILRYMGWVRHRLAKPGQTVRGLIVTQDHDDRLTYAASMVPNLTVKRVALSFTVNTEDLSLPQ
jgi:hypothetical protein